MGNSSTSQAEANQQQAQAQAEAYLKSMLSQGLAGIKGMPAAPASSWAGIANPGKNMVAQAYNPQTTPLMRALIGSSPRAINRATGSTAKNTT